MSTIYRERLPFHPLLGRNIHFDSRSLAYALQSRRTVVTGVRHKSFIGILDQGQLGSCTGNAGVSCLYHEPILASADLPAWNRYTENEAGAVALYSDATSKDPYAGSYPPDDTGSDGLTVCQILKAAGDISGYQAALDLESSLEALMVGPGVTGIPWYNSMFDPGPGGLLSVSANSGLAGGHELCVDQVILPGDPGNGTGELLVAGPNSWGTSWGDAGRYAIRSGDWWRLRQDQGDFYSMIPMAQPAPIPTPTPADDPAGDALWSSVRHWATKENHVGDNRRAATAVKTWAKSTGRS